MKKEGLKEEIVKLREQGLSYNEIVKKLNCAKSTVSYYCKNLSIDPFLKDINIDKIIELRTLGISYDNIRTETGESLDKIKKVCRLKKLNNSNFYRKPSNEDIENMQSYYDECGSSVKVSKKFGWSKFTVLKYLKIKIKEKQTIEERKANNIKQVIDWRRKAKIKILEYAGNKCVICGYAKSKSALHFHHTDPEQKDFTIGGKSYSFEKLKKEADKCILVCSNCHSEIHDEINKEGCSTIVNKYIKSK